MHNLRVLKYGSQLHVDCHITLPYYDTLEAIHQDVNLLEDLVRERMQGEIEFFIHSDPCLPESCPICPIQECQVREAPFIRRLEWTMANMLPDKRHELKEIAIS